MEKVAESAALSPFNGTLETGVRAVIILYTSIPRFLDIQRLTAMDYLLVRTSLLSGPADLHPKSPITTPATQVRRKTVQNAIDLMMSRDLIARVVDRAGISYTAGDSAALFFYSLQAPYLKQLVSRAEWLNGFLASHDDAEFNGLMNSLLSNWVSEFDTHDYFGADSS